MVDVVTIKRPYDVCELVREGRVSSAGFRLHDAATVARVVAPLLSDLPHEEILVLCIDTQNKLRYVHRAARGGLHASSIAASDVYRAAIISGCLGIILVHNHPSGSPEPSAEDIAFTRKVRAGADVLGLQFLDHVVFASRTSFVSFHQRGMLDE